MTSSYWYVGSPYTRYPDGKASGFYIACVETARLLKAGVPVFSPIAHSHVVATAGNMSLGDDAASHAAWLKLDELMMAPARGLIVLRMNGWEESVGLKHEIEFFQARSKPIVMMTPGVVPFAVLPVDLS